MELKVKSLTLPEAIEFNFDELKTEISERTSAYIGIVYTDDQMKEAKQDVAMLRKFTKALSDERIRVKKEIMKPYDAFEAKVKELSSIVDKAIVDIDAQIKTYDAIKQDEKKANIEEMFKNMLFPEFVKIEQIWNAKWLNATFSMNNIEKELLEKKETIIKECQTLATLPSYSHEAVHFYQKTLDIAQALAKVRELTEAEEAKKRMLEEEAGRKEEEAKKKEEPQPVPEEAKAEIKEEPVIAAPAPHEESKWVAFEALLTKDQAIALKNFFDNNHITFRPMVQGARNA